MESANAIEVVINDLEAIAESHGDIVPLVYQRFFDVSDDGKMLMGHSDIHMQGRMFEQVLELLFTDDHFGPGCYLQWELENHLDAYGATPSMYQAFFEAVVSVAKSCLGEDWQLTNAEAWQQRVDQILTEVTAYEASNVGQSASI
ncbi:MAG: hypothetical protein GKR90_15710 [Pseudomonadales bacterium]|nr:hypothetical protein [Pseudomonadales bacterium]